MMEGDTMRTPLQQYLDAGNSPQRLKEEFGINSYEHPELPLIGFKYSQIDSPRTHEVVKWSRGTVLEKGTWNLVAQPFVRFFNLGEGGPEDVKRFDWDNFRCWTKEDGSLSIVYYYAGEWHSNTSGSFGFGPISTHDVRSWRQVVREVSNFDWDKLDKGITYIFELCTPWNKVIRHYPVPRMVMLGAFVGPDECTPDKVVELASIAGATMVESHDFHSIDEIEDFLAKKEKDDATFEGVVVRDLTGLRYKIKSRTYLSLAHMYGNGDLGLPKRILPFVLAGETSEVLSYFPELKDQVAEVKTKVDEEYKKLLKTWKETHGIESQKEFALAIKPQTQFTGILFGLRKVFGKDQTEENVKKAWMDSVDIISKMLF